MSETRRAADPLLAVVYEALAEYAGMVAARRRVSATDPVADTLAFVGRDLGERLRRAEAADVRLSPETYAALPHVRTSAQTIRNWCGRGELPGAIQTARGWAIPRDARRVRPPRRRPEKSPQ